MSGQQPTPEAARTALDEVEAHRSAVRASDRLYGPILLVIAASFVAGTVLLTVISSPGLPGWVGPLEGFAGGWFVVAVVGAVMAVSGLQRARSRTGTLMFGGSLVAFWLWTGGVRNLASNFGWEVVGDPARDAHFVVGAVISVVPLLAGAWVISRRR